MSDYRLPFYHCFLQQVAVLTVTHFFLSLIGQKKLKNAQTGFKNTRKNDILKKYSEELLSESFIQGQENSINRQIDANIRKLSLLTRDG